MGCIAKNSQTVLDPSGKGIHIQQRPELQCLWIRLLKQLLDLGIEMFVYIQQGIFSDLLVVGVAGGIDICGGIGLGVDTDEIEKPVIVTRINDNPALLGVPEVNCAKVLGDTGGFGVIQCLLSSHEESEGILS
jgi:hypothetical protein